MNVILCVGVRERERTIRIMFACDMAYMPHLVMPCANTGCYDTLIRFKRNDQSILHKSWLHKATDMQKRNIWLDSPNSVDLYLQ